MPEARTYHYDAAPAISIGRRAQQEDAVAVDFAEGADVGFVVLADGMGGHAAGDLASRIAVTEVFSALKMLCDDPAAMEDRIGEILLQAVSHANACIGDAARDSQNLSGMGTTLVSPVVFGNRLYWVSVGDSALYLLRGSRLYRLNQEHSLARRMDALVAAGKLARDAADQHPERDCLTSALTGQRIPEIDCCRTCVDLHDGDILIAASDGLGYIGATAIAQTVYAKRDASSGDIGAALLKAIRDLDDPEQDNVALCVLKTKAHVHSEQYTSLAAIRQRQEHTPDHEGARR